MRLGNHSTACAACWVWIVVAVGTVPALAKTIYVSKAGNNANDGLTWATAKLTVREGLNTAVADDQVWVAAGTYVENITLVAGVALYGGFAGGETDLAQRDWVTNETILDGNQARSVVTSPSGATATTRIDGFTIRNGIGNLSGSYGYRKGGGIYCISSSPTIANNTITANTIVTNSGGYGGGIFCSGGSPTITNNTIAGNSMTVRGSGYGGGIYCISSSPTITNNSIRGNTANARNAGYGGGICCVSCTSPITNNTIAGNRAPTLGGGIYCVSSLSIIANNTIAGNTADAEDSSCGGGIYCDRGSSIITSNMITSNTIIGNTVIPQGSSLGGGICCFSCSSRITNNTIAVNTIVTYSDGYGGGIFCSDSSLAIANNTITGNTIVAQGNGYGGGLCCEYASATIANTIVAFNSSGIYKTGSGTMTLRHDCVFGNTAYNYSGVADPTSTNGNISADPLFVQPVSPGLDGQWGTPDDDYGDLRLQPASPCIDAGDNSAVPADVLDLDDDGDTAEPIPLDLAGVPRFIDDPFTIDNGLGMPPIVDMGAHEYFTDCNANGIPDTDEPDEDGDKVINDCDACPGTPSGAPVDEQGCPLAMLQSSNPATGKSLWRNWRNIIRLTFDADIVAPYAGAVMIQEMLAGGAYGDDLSGGFAFTVENDVQGQPRVLKIQEVGSSLMHRKWYAVRNTGAWPGVAPFTVQYVVQVGDANNDGRVLNTDFGLINAAIPTFSTADDDRRDINGDGRILNTDFGVLNAKIPSFPVVKPSGH